jgi:amino acid transporter
VAPTSTDDSDRMPARLKRRGVGAVLVVLALGYVAAYVLMAVFAIRGQPAAEAWAAALGSAGFLVFAVAIDLPHRVAGERVIILLMLLSSLGAIGAATMSESAWTRAGWAMSCAALGTFGLLIWRERRRKTGTWSLWES